MALQGTLDTFALPDVLRLLASTNKSGCLHVTGSRGAGDVWFHGGGIVAADTAAALPTSEPVEVLCELLRNVDGHFSFEADAVREDAAEAAPAEIEPLLVEAEQLVAEWAEIEQVVPSMDAWVNLVEDLPKAKVSVDAATWKVIIAVGGGSTVRDVGTWMGLGELAVSRGVRDLVRLGLAEISEAPAVADVEAEAGVSPFGRDADADAVAPEWENAAPWAEETQWVEDAGYLSFEPEPFVPLSFDQRATETLAEALPEIPDTPADDVLGTHSVAERDSAFQEPVGEALVDEEPTPVDRSRLLKFLGSVGK